MTKDIYISSLAFLGFPPEKMIEIAKNNDFALEFSSGIAFQKEMERLYLNAPIKKMLHNYFPAPAVPFVLNLASINDKIRNESINHCKRGLLLAKNSFAPFYSAHAGFCIDPEPGELGKKISFDTHINRGRTKQLFLESVMEILKTADDLGINFLVENNVIAAFNLIDTINPLLCCNAEEIKWLFNSIPHKRLGLLLDTAHLKVSCNTLHLSLDKEIEILKPYIKGIHHSDNEGMADNNLPMDSNYWFLPYLKQYKNVTHVIEVKNIDVNIIKKQIKLLQLDGC